MKLLFRKLCEWFKNSSSSIKVVLITGIVTLLAILSILVLSIYIWVTKSNIPDDIHNINNSDIVDTESFKYSNYFWYSSDNVSKYSLKFLGAVSTKGSLLLHVDGLGNMYGTYVEVDGLYQFHVSNTEHQLDGYIQLMNRQIHMTLSRNSEQILFQNYY